MASRFDSYTTKTTNILYPWPKELTGVERVALSARGDLQRVLSAFLARPITVARVSSHSYTLSNDGSSIPFELPNSEIIALVSPTQPIYQKRRVDLICAGRVVCSATSTVIMSSPRSARLFLEEKYAIGQMFSQLGNLPSFELLGVGFDDGTVSGKSALGGVPSTPHKSGPLWRKYKLSVPEFESEIIEVFPSRDMFTYGEDWLTGSYTAVKVGAPEVQKRSESARYVFLVMLLIFLAGLWLSIQRANCRVV